MMDQPIALFYGGTNGSGKSTLRELDADTTIKKHIDPDAIARIINPQDPRAADVAAGREAIHQFQTVIASKTSFTMETTLTGSGILRRIAEARAAGFLVQLRYVGLARADLNIERVANRVARGGHHIDEHVIRRRYQESLENLLKAITLCDMTFIRDNSGKQAICHLALEGRQICYSGKSPLPDWIVEIQRQIS
ncbi:zeta toxin family protein [Undibacterium sp. JH2W]|uniref:zeta toxin family protein n=1 Tax=Undibacterium sp. JH2W TaxID=3413037 RepID=UPI003BEF742B